jgi:membrane protein DedA with SNARE-associated domain
MAGVVHDVLAAIPAWAVYLAVFLLPFAEAAILLGFVIPGETALVFGGVLAGQGQVNGFAVLVIAVVGAVTGDGVGYLVGRRYGAALQQTRVGRLVGDDRWKIAEEFVRRRGGPAVFFGRFTALLRALVPGIAGMAGMHYPTFAIWNLLGGLTWAGACVLGGWAIGDVIGTYLSDASYVVVGFVVLVAAILLIRHRLHRRPGRSAGS